MSLVVFEETFRIMEVQELADSIYIIHCYKNKIYLRFSINIANNELEENDELRIRVEKCSPEMEENPLDELDDMQCLLIVETTCVCLEKDKESSESDSKIYCNFSNNQVPFLTMFVVTKEDVPFEKNQQYVTYIRKL